MTTKALSYSGDSAYAARADPTPPFLIAARQMTAMAARANVATASP